MKTNSLFQVRNKINRVSYGRIVVQTSLHFNRVLEILVPTVETW